MSRRILITGGFGYLGGRIAVELLERNDYIVRLGTRKQRSSCSWLPQAEVMTMNITEASSLREALQDVQCVVHLAAMNEHDCARDPEQAICVNTLGTHQLLNASIEAGVERFIYFSTAHVYGTPLLGAISEHTVPRPTHPYAITHRAAEDFVLAAHSKKALDGIVLRLSNGFGAPTHVDVDRWTLLVNDLARQAVFTKKMLLQSHGLQMRDFITLSDVGRAVHHILALTREQCSDGLFNLGGDMPLSIWEMTKRIEERCQIVLGFSPEITRPVALNGVRDVPKTFAYESSKIKETGYTLDRQVDAAIDETLRFMENEYERITETYE
jgi:UDP-glucose 4-epimerase